MEFLGVVARRIRLIAAVVLGGTLLAFLIALVTPNTYEAEVQLLPPRAPTSRTGALLSSSPAANLLPLEALGLGGNTEPELLAKLLESRTVTDTVIRKFDLMTVYKQRTIENARRRLDEAVTIDSDRKSSMVTVTVEDRDPSRARDMAAVFAQEANRLTNDIESSRAGQERRFLEKRLAEVKKDLEGAEVQLKEFSAKHGTLDIREQTKATIQAIASLRAELAMREVRLSYLSSFAGGEEANAIRTRREIAGIKRQLKQLEIGETTKKGDGDGAKPDVLAPIAEVPELALEYTRRLRELRIQEGVFELLTKQYELARINEARDTANAFLVDAAVLPTQKASPRYSYYLAGGFLLSLLLALLLAHWRDQIARDPIAREQWQGFLAELRRVVRRTHRRSATARDSSQGSL